LRRLRHQPGLYGVILDILECRGQVIVIAHEAIKILSPPYTTLPVEMSVNQVSGGGFPGLYDVAQSRSLDLLGQDMHMIWHDAPGNEAVSPSVISQERVFDELGACGVSEKAFATPGVKQLVTMNCRGGLCARRQGISQAEDNVLNELDAVAVREIAARIPAAMGAR
jgi:hypothetical protein